MPTGAEMAAAQANAARVWSAAFGPKVKTSEQDIRRRHLARADQRASDASFERRCMRPA